MSTTNFSLARKLSSLLRWGAGSIAVALALAGCGGGDAVSPTAAAPTQLDQVATLTLAQQSVNARLALPRAVALAAVSSGTATEDFENGMADWSDWGNAQVVAGVGTSGSKAMQVGTGAGGAGLIVAGIVPGTAYRLTAQVKVSDPADPVFIGIDMRSASGDHVIGQSSPAVSSTGYATVTVDLVAPPNSASAVVWIWKNAGTGDAYLDDVSFGPATGTPPPPPPGANLVSNGGFENGMADWVNWGNASAVAGQANSGAAALSVGTGAGGAGQSVVAIVPGSTYRLVAQAKVSDPSETVFVGVNLLNQAGAAVAQIAQPVSSATYSPVSLDIIAPADAVNAIVYVWKNAGNGFGSVDDVVFGVASGSAAPPPPPWANMVANNGFENGLANWVNWGNTIITTEAAAGSSAAKIGVAAGGFGQVVNGVVAGTSYTLTAQVKVSNPLDILYFGLKFMDAAGTVLAQKYVTFTSFGPSSGYSGLQIDLPAPPNSTSALVYAWKNDGTAFASVDEVVLSQAVSTPSATPEQVSRTASRMPLQVAQLANGGHVVVWSAPPAGSANPVVYAQLFDASGQKQGAPVTVFAAPAVSTNGFAAGGVAGLPDGSFLVSGMYESIPYTRGFSQVLVQKVSGSGQLLASGGVSDPTANGGLADRLLLDTDINTIALAGGPLFVNPDGSYVLQVTKTVSAPGFPGGSVSTGLLLNVDPGGNVVGAPVDLSGSDYMISPAVVRLTGGNFMVAGISSNYPSASAAIKIVTNTGQEIGRQTRQFVDSTPVITALADGSGMVAWHTIEPQPGGFRGERIDAGGNAAGTASVPDQYGGRVTGLAGGGYVFTWRTGTQLLAQYFTTSGQVAGGAFVLVDNMDTGHGAPRYAIAQGPGGFRVVYQAATSAGPQIFEIDVAAPALN